MDEHTEKKEGDGGDPGQAIPDVSALDFAPDWARKAPRVERREAVGGRGDAPRRGGEDRRGSRPAGGRDGRPPPGRRGPGKGKDRTAPRSARDAGDREGAPSGRRRFDEGPVSRDRSGRGAPVDLPVDIRFLPEFKALEAIVRKIQHSRRAYPLRDMARLFLDNETACILRLEISKKPDGVDAPPGLFQCALCGTPALDRADLERHLLKTHLDEHFERVEEKTDPPSGTFPSVIRCGVTGELLGPPNHHSTGERIREILRTTCASMDEETYRARLETSHDEALIEQWREQACRRVRYRRRGIPAREEETPARDPEAESGERDGEAGDAAPDSAPLLDLQQAEFVMLREIVPGLIRSGRRISCLLKAAKKSPSEGLLHWMHDAWRREHRYPASLAFALRGAFRHRKLHVFKANDAHGPEFVSAAGFSPLDPRHAVPEIRAILDHVSAHPGGSVSEMIAALERDVGLECDAVHLRSQVRWLVEKGHLILYFNGEVSPPAPHPIFRNIPDPTQKERP